MRTNSIGLWIATVFGLAALALAACDDSQVKEERARLELATVKGDLDQTYLSLKLLADKGDTAAQTRLPAVAMAIEARERMQVAVNDHDHEQAVLAASDLLQRHDKNKDAVKVLRESGQILYLLRAAQNAIGEYGADDPPASAPATLDAASLADPARRKEYLERMTLAALRDLGKEPGPSISDQKTKAILSDYAEKAKLDPKTGITEELVRALLTSVADKKTNTARDDLTDRRFTAIGRARQEVARARTLDPQFKGSLQLEDLLERAHAAMVMQSVNRIKLFGDLSLLLAGSMHEKIVGILNDAASSRSGSVSQAWSLVSPIAEKIKKSLEENDLMDMQREIRRLSTYKSGPAADVADQGQKFALFVQTGISRFLEPTGNLLDFRRAASEVMAERQQYKNRLDAAIPKDISARAAESLKTVTGYKLFRYAETPEILKKNENLFSL